MTGAPRPHRFDDLDAMVAVAIQREEARSPLQGVDALAVEAIVALSHAGMDLIGEGQRPMHSDLTRKRLLERGRAQLDAARDLIGRFTITREAAE